MEEMREFHLRIRAGGFVLGSRCWGRDSKKSFVATRRSVLETILGHCGNCFNDSCNFLLGFLCIKIERVIWFARADPFRIQFPTNRSQKNNKKKLKRWIGRCCFKTSFVWFFDLNNIYRHLQQHKIPSYKTYTVIFNIFNNLYNIYTIMTLLIIKTLVFLFSFKNSFAVNIFAPVNQCLCGGKQSLKGTHRWTQGFFVNLRFKTANIFFKGNFNETIFKIVLLPTSKFSIFQNSDKF